VQPLAYYVCVWLVLCKYDLFGYYLVFNLYMITSLSFAVDTVALSLMLGRASSRTLQGFALWQARVQPKAALALGNYACISAQLVSVAFAAFLFTLNRQPVANGSPPPSLVVVVWC
jgi:hypothetical protein